jgi:hypothetical protein
VKINTTYRAIMLFEAIDYGTDTIIPAVMMCEFIDEKRGEASERLVKGGATTTSSSTVAVARRSSRIIITVKELRFIKRTVGLHHYVMRHKPMVGRDERPNLSPEPIWIQTLLTFYAALLLATRYNTDSLSKHTEYLLYHSLISTFFPNWFTTSSININVKKTAASAVTSGKRGIFYSIFQSCTVLSHRY